MKVCTFACIVASAAAFAVAAAHAATNPMKPAPTWENRRTK